ncbi:MAG: hypothetical protein KAR40_07895 [Candidatus Sabulitectum sp.]|nr:hypothetical protein [Candidatus Sabulitectum sp.]
MTVRLKLIDRADLEEVWPIAGPLIDMAIQHAHGETTLEHLYKDLTLGERKLIMVTEEGKTLAAAVLSMSHYPRKKVCQVSFAGGQEMDKWCDQALPTVERIAREAGADTVRIQGRKGWLRRLRDHGYDDRGIVIEKELEA